MNTTFLSGSIFLKAFVFITFFGLFSMIASGSMRINVPDSIGVENVNNKQVILHQLEPKETYYGLSRQYDVPLQDLIQFNNNKPLTLAEIIRLPTSRAVLSASETAAQAAAREAKRELAAADTTTHVANVQIAP